MIAIVIAGLALGDRHDRVVPAAGAGPGGSPAATVEQAKGIRFEAYQRPDPTLPTVPAGTVKKFRVTVDEHVAQVSRRLAPTEVWTFGVNGRRLAGTGASPPMVVNRVGGSTSGSPRKATTRS